MFRLQWNIQTRHSLPRIVALTVATTSCGYPTPADVEASLEQIQASGSDRVRQQRAMRLLSRLSSPETVADDALMTTALKQVFQLATASPLGDDAVLAAIDAAPIDGGFGMELCGGYYRILALPAVRERYRRSSELRRRIGACAGLTSTPISLDSQP
jgi:hypothetical protein